MPNTSEALRETASTHWTSTHWTELLKCPNCGRAGAVQLSQPEGRAYDVSVEVIPAGFKVADLGFGEVLCCRDCNCQAATKYPGQLHSISE
jgi:hypothetical protein